MLNDMESSAFYDAALSARTVCAIDAEILDEVRAQPGLTKDTLNHEFRNAYDRMDDAIADARIHWREEARREQGGS